MVLNEESYGEIQVKQTGEADRQWKQRTMEGRKTKEEMDRKKESQVTLLRFQDRSWTYFTGTRSTIGIENNHI